MILSGSPFDFIEAFVGGVILSFTPCVYPLIPITVGYIGVRSGGSKHRGFVLSLLYVTGMAITYSLLGLLASLTGRIFGSFSSHPLTLIIVGLIIIVFGVSMLNGFMSLPNFVKIPNVKKRGYFSVFLLGLTSGLVVSPCVTPVLFAILSVIFAKKNLIYGMGLLLSFAYGMGLILVLVGTFSSILVNLPKSGKWLVYIKRACAFILLAAGAYIVYIGIRRI